VRTSPVVRKLAFLTCAAAFALSVRAQTSITVDATKPVRVVDDRMFGVNTAVWDGVFTDPQTLTTLQAVDARFLRYPGGSSSDDFHCPGHHHRKLWHRDAGRGRRLGGLLKV
jgi:hypothetical protein